MLCIPRLSPTKFILSPQGELRKTKLGYTQQNDLNWLRGDFMAIVTYTAEEAKHLKGDTDWERVNSMTDEEIHQAALDDPDAQPLTPYELTRFKPFILLRKKLKL
jgi:hypothetical protein